MSFYVSTVQPGSITMMVRKMIKIPFLPAVPAVPAEISTLTFNITDNVMKEDVCQRGYPADWVGALTRGMNISGRVVRVALNQSEPKIYMDLSIYMTYAVQIIDKNYRWNGTAEITLQKLSDGLYKLDKLFLRNNDEYQFDYGTNLDGILFRTGDSNVPVFSIIDVNADVYPKQLVSNQQLSFKYLGQARCDAASQVCVGLKSQLTAPFIQAKLAAQNQEISSLDQQIKDIRYQSDLIKNCSTYTQQQQVMKTQKESQSQNLKASISKLQQDLLAIRQAQATADLSLKDTRTSIQDTQALIRDQAVQQRNIELEAATLQTQQKELISGAALDDSALAKVQTGLKALQVKLEQMNAQFQGDYKEYAQLTQDLSRSRTSIQELDALLVELASQRQDRERTLELEVQIASKQSEVLDIQSKIQRVGDVDAMQQQTVFKQRADFIFLLLVILCAAAFVYFMITRPKSPSSPVASQNQV